MKKYINIILYVVGFLGVEVAAVLLIGFIEWGSNINETIAVFAGAVMVFGVGIFYHFSMGHLIRK